MSYMVKFPTVMTRRNELTAAADKGKAPMISYVSIPK